MKCDIKAVNSSTLCKFHEGREGLRPMGSNADRLHIGFPAETAIAFGTSEPANNLVLTILSLVSRKRKPRERGWPVKYYGKTPKPTMSSCDAGQRIVLLLGKYVV